MKTSFSSLSNIVRKEYEERAELRRIRGMRAADFLAEHDNPAAHFMATDTPVREAGVSGPPGQRESNWTVLWDPKRFGPDPDLRIRTNELRITEYNTFSIILELAFFCLLF
jgi:hypothetical protein